MICGCRDLREVWGYGLWLSRCKRGTEVWAVGCVLLFVCDAKTSLPTNSAVCCFLLFHRVKTFSLIYTTNASGAHHDAVFCLKSLNVSNRSCDPTTSFERLHILSVYKVAVDDSHTVREPAQVDCRLSRRIEGQMDPRELQVSPHLFYRRSLLAIPTVNLLCSSGLGLGFVQFVESSIRELHAPSGVSALPAVMYRT